MWYEVKQQSDLTYFMDIMYGFHDSCIKEIKYLSGAFVNERLGMYPINDVRNLRMIIQRQFKDIPMIEMEFSGLNHLYLVPNNEDFTCEILDATMLMKDDCIYWCDCGGISEKEIDDYGGTVVCAAQLRWRVLDQPMGKEELYILKHETV